MLNSTFRKREKKLSDSDIRQLFRYEPTPFELLPTSGSYIFTMTEQSTTVDRFMVTEIKHSPSEELKKQFTTSRERDGVGVSPDETTARAIAIPDNENSRLELAAAAGDQHAFLMVFKTIDWSERSPEEIVHAVRLALQAGAHLIARRLATEGTAKYPEDTELQKMARILAPPVVKPTEGKPNTDWKANREWLRSHWGEYRGRWVALKDGNLLAAGDSLNDLVSQVGDIRGTGIMVTPVQ